MKKLYFRLSWFVFASLVLSACGGAIPTVTPSSPTPYKTLTPLPSQTPTLIFTPTITSFPAEFSDLDPQGNAIPMRLVSAGEFTMGSDSGDSGEQPVHPVYLDAYYMDQYEVTNVLYKACVSVGVCDPPQITSHYNDTKHERHPVVYVDWNMAKTYCDWRDAQLPSEAQWEKAARGTDGRTYPWGEGVSCTKANYYDSTKSEYCVGDTTQVGSYESGISPYGLYDMAGNVWEWVSSLYSSYPYVFTDGREDLTATGPRVLRGGSWNKYEDVLRASDRLWLDPSDIFVYVNVGFRCSRSP